MGLSKNENELSHDSELLGQCSQINTLFLIIQTLLMPSSCVMIFLRDVLLINCIPFTQKYFGGKSTILCESQLGLMLVILCRGKHLKKRLMTQMLCRVRGKSLIKRIYLMLSLSMLHILRCLCLHHRIKREFWNF